MAAVSDDLGDEVLAVEKGDAVSVATTQFDWDNPMDVLEAAQYEWSSPFEVESVDEDSWRAPTGAVWRSRRVELESTAANFRRRRGCSGSSDCVTSPAASSRMASSRSASTNSGRCSAMGDDEQTVYVKPRNRAGRVPKLHTDRDCPWLAKCDRVYEKPRSVFGDDREMCKHCTGTADTYCADERTQDTRDLLSDLNPEDVGLSPLRDGGDA